MTSLHVVQVVRSDSFAGVERYVCDVSHGLVQRGHRVTVVGGDPAVMRRELPDAATYRPAATTAQVARALSSCGRPAVVHAHMTAAELGAVLSRPVHRAPVVGTRHFASTRGSSLPARAVGACLQKALAAEVSISDFVARQTGPGSTVIPNGVADRAPRPRVGVQRHVLCLQRLEQEKQPLVAVDAFAQSGLAENGWRLRIAGRGALSGSVDARVRALGLEASVDMLGFVDDVERELVAAACLLATAPSEPFGLSVVQASALAVPVVAAAGGAHIETLQGSDLLFPPGDARTAADVLRRVAGDPDGAALQGERAQARQRAHYSLETHVGRLVELYDGLSTGRG